MEIDFEHMLRFLVEYSWIYNFKVTDFISGQHWRSLPKEWVECLLALSVEELNELPFGFSKDEWPASLKTFVQQALTFGIGRTPAPRPGVEIPPQLCQGMSPKKQHEVSRMADYVHSAATEAGCDIIVDVGSGLGYLGQVLHSTYGHWILGLESKAGHTHGADSRNSVAVKNGIKNITFELDQSEECRECFRKEVETAWFEFHSGGRESQNKNCTPQKRIGARRDADKVKSVVGSHSNNEDCTKVKTEHCNRKRGDVDCTGSCLNPVLRHFREEKKDHDGSCVTSHYEAEVAEEINDRLTDGTGQNSDPQPACHVRDRLDVSLFEDDVGGRAEVGGQADFGVRIQPRVCMIGLHCCGDLTPTMMEFFAELECVRVLCCVSCCFHRMELEESGNNIKNFPMSTKVKSSVAQVGVDGSVFSLTKYGLRLAAQETRSRWRHQTESDHKFHERNVAYRGVLQLYLQSESIHSEKLVRKLTRRADTVSFSSYVQTVLRNMKLQTDSEVVLDGDTVRTKLHQLFDENQNSFQYIEPFTVLQVMLQPVLESLLYYDRQAWLQEQDIRARVVPIFDEYISPRNLALTASKHSVT
ncbi:hypothetical protein ScPMuIL_002508 [Solemya velum]